MENDIRKIVTWLPVSGRFVRVSLLGVGLENDPAVLLSSFTGLIILMIPGNPGNEQFYADFGQIVLNKISRIMQISRENSLFCAVSHLNHVPMPREYQGMSIYNCADRISLADQIRHKFNFCLQYLPKTARLIIVGHSIGSYFMLKILPDLLKNEFNVVRCIALFPTIEHMAESPKGELLLPWIKKLCKWDKIVQILFSWLVYLPNFVKERVCTFVIKNCYECFSPCILQSTIEIVDINVIRNIIFMAMDELSTVSNLDRVLLHYSDRCRFLYGTVDHWCPLSYALEMQKRLGKVVIDDKKCEHAFVLNHQEIVAHKVAKWIAECYGNCPIIITVTIIYEDGLRILCNSVVQNILPIFLYHLCLSL
ncbi:Lipid droplet-associated hydrolase [Dirofilaria immitis]